MDGWVARLCCGGRGNAELPCEVIGVLAGEWSAVARAVLLVTRESHLVGPTEAERFVFTDCGGLLGASEALRAVAALQFATSDGLADVVSAVWVNGSGAREDGPDSACGLPLSVGIELFLFLAASSAVGGAEASDWVMLTCDRMPGS